MNMTFQDVHCKVPSLILFYRVVLDMFMIQPLAIMGQSGYSAAFICEGKTKKAPAFSLFWISFCVKTCWFSARGWEEPVVTEQHDPQTIRPHEGVIHRHQHLLGEGWNWKWTLDRSNQTQLPWNHHHQAVHCRVYGMALFWWCIPLAMQYQYSIN